MEKKYRILYANHTTEIGGAEQSLVSLVCGIDRKVFYPIVVLPNVEGPLVNRFKEHEIEVVSMPLYRLRWRNPFPYIFTVFRLARFIKQNKIDIIHSNIRFTNQYLVPASKLTGVPLISHVRALLSREWFYEYFFWLSNILVANSHATEESYRPHLRKTQKSVVIYNGVNLEWFVPNKNRNAIRKKYGINEKTFLIGVVGSIVPNKGHIWFIEAMKKLSESYADFCVLIVGDTKMDSSEYYLEKVKDCIQTLGLADKVVFTGLIEDIADVYDSINLLVLSSCKESFGRVIIEAMAMECPVIGTNSGGVNELIADGETGILVPYKNTDELVNAILKIIRNPELGGKFSREGRRRVEELFDIKFHIQKIQQLYIDTLTTG